MKKFLPDFLLPNEQKTRPRRVYTLSPPPATKNKPSLKHQMLITISKISQKIPNNSKIPIKKPILADFTVSDILKLSIGRRH